MTIAEKPHGRTRYNAGCRCGECRQANREHSRRRRRAEPLHAVTTPPPEVTPADPITAGAVAAAVRAQLDHLAAVDDRPALAAIAIALAEVLDNPSAVPQHAAAAHRLIETLDKLGQNAGRRSRLTAVRNMTPR